ncbi:Molybdopterin molybdenumtransferase [hydrothermal vent metagenome]|uniref:molybdopterin molybdotransferase n=1 Tax=hydrothermal vent metagenome TaxID=652676 RepID=A0A3B0U2B9_9ZZZZ
MLAYEKALQRVLEASNILGSEKISLNIALGRVLATPVNAMMNQPPFDGSAMDGYAVIASEVKPGAVLQNIGESQAGSGFDGKLASGQCIRIFTGAPMPKGANAVIMQEYCSVNGDQVSFERSVEPAQNVRPLGQDFMKGQQLLDVGTAINPAVVALIAAANVDQIEVFKRPNISILATGNELVAPGSDMKPGQIVGSNGFALSALFFPLAEQIIDIGSASDNENELREKFKEALSGPSDVIISTGGASVGDYDLVLPVLKSLGVEIDFWKIAIRPGKPIIFGKKNNKLIFALPGNPVSAYVCAVSVVIPAIRAMVGCNQAIPKSLSLPLASSLPANGIRRHFMRGKIVEIDGQSHVEPILQTDSSHLSSLAQADVLLVALENQGELPAGTIVQTIPLP